MSIAKYTKEVLEPIIKESVSYSDICRKLGLVVSGGSIQHLQSRIKKFSIDISHFTHKSGRVIGDYKHFLPLEKLLINGSIHKSGKIKNRLIKARLKEMKCEKCELLKWNEDIIPLELDHINGNRFDNRLENLRLLCPNCHAQTSTYCGKNKRTIIKNMDR